VADGLKAVLKPAFDHEHPWLAVGQQMRDRLGRRGDMRRDDGRSEVRGRHGGNRQFRPVVRPQGDAIAAAHPQTRERSGQPLGCRAVLRPGQALAVARRAQRHPVGDAGDARLEGERESVGYCRDGRLACRGCGLHGCRCHASRIIAAAAASPH
jgi:hypothetical protein